MVKTLRNLLEDNRKREERLRQNLFKMFHKNNPACSIQAVLEEGLDLNIPDRNERRPLHYAAAAKNPEYIDLCLRFGADPNAKDQNGRTALHVASASHISVEGVGRGWNIVNKQKECMDLLINASPKLLHLKDNQGMTPLFDCLKNVGAGVSWDLATHMLERGADITVVDKRQQNLAHHILKEAGCRRAKETEAPLKPRVLFETQCLLRLLVNLEPQLLSQRGSQGPNGLTPFMMVCLWGNTDLIFYFLKEHCAICELLQAGAN